MPTIRKTIVTLGMAAAVAAPLTGFSTSAQAASRNGVCEEGEFCLYWGSGQWGSVSDFSYSVSNYGSSQPSCYEFKGAGAGQGECIKNNSWSVWNRTNRPVTVYYNSGYTGPSQTFEPGATGMSGMFNDTLRNENASHRIG